MSQFHSVRVNSETGAVTNTTNSPAPSTPEPPLPSKVSPLGRVRVQMGADGQAHIENLTGTRSATSAPVTADPLSNIRNSYGIVVSPSAASPSDILTLPGGASCTIASARQAGLVGDGPSGLVLTEAGRAAAGFTKAGSTKETRPNPAGDQITEAKEPDDATQTNEAEAPVDFTFSPESQAAISQVGERVGEPTREALVSALISGTATDRLLGDVAQALGQEVTETRTAINSVVAELTPMAMKVVGMDAQEFNEFTDWIWQRHPEQAHKAVSDVSDFRTGKLKALATKFASDESRYTVEELATATFYDRDGNKLEGVTARRVGAHTVLMLGGKEIALRDVLNKISRTTTQEG